MTVIGHHKLIMDLNRMNDKVGEENEENNGKQSLPLTSSRACSLGQETPPDLGIPFSDT